MPSKYSCRSLKGYGLVNPGISLVLKLIMGENSSAFTTPTVPDGTVAGLKALLDSFVPPMSWAGGEGGIVPP